MKKNLKTLNLLLISFIFICQQKCYAAGIGASSTIAKFFFAMFGVIVSSLAIFLGLKIYQKFILKTNVKFDNIDYDKTLQSPKDFKEAVNLFLDKTNK
ncbi:MAG: hypothetical protein PHC64_05395 [Candidatus Gastranaerophilales bacterium]|nr:hypothetical protein [Candidatus Gastranaerophilales bacterium]